MKYVPTRKKEWIVTETITWRVAAENIQQAEKLVKCGHQCCELVDNEVLARAELHPSMFEGETPEA